MPTPKNPKNLGGGRGLRRWLILSIPYIFLLVAPILLLSHPEPVKWFHNLVFDTYQRLRPRSYSPVPVRIIDIDDESLSRLGQWPWPRTLLAQTVRRLSELGAASIAFDAVFPEPDRTSPKQVLPLWTNGRPSPAITQLIREFPDHDDVFARAIATSHVVLGSVLTDTENGTVPLVKASFILPGGNPVPFLDEYSGSVANRPELEKVAAGNGSFTYLPERDGIIRRVPLVMRLGNRLIPSLAADALRVAQGADSIIVKSSQSAGDTARINKIKIGNLSAPTDGKGRLWIYFTESVPERTIPIWQIFERKFDPKTLSHAIIFIGTSASGLKDQRATPLAPVTPGVAIHAQVAEQILLQDFLIRPEWSVDAEAVFLVVFGVILIVILQRRGAIWGLGAATLIILAAFSVGWRAFTHRQWLLDPLFPSLTIALIYLSFALTSYVQGEREKRAIRDAFRYYLSPELVDQLASHPESLKLGGEMRRMTFHFCDIQGFTSISEFYDPYALIRLLNSFLSPLTEVILKHKGTIDKYIGDCIVAFWNAPVDDPQHARNACLAVIEMHERLKRLNEERRIAAEAEGKEFFPIHIRTGLNSGNCIVGNMGSHQRFSYSVLGDDVNLASRLEGANKFFGTYIMASEATVAEARDAIETRLLGWVRVVGKVVPIKVFELLAKKGELSEEWEKALSIYDRGLKEFHAREFEQAAKSFQEVLAIFPNDGPSSLYLKTATDYSVIPPPEGWDSVFNLTMK